MGLRGLVERVAVVVGGATGIGAATAARLGEEGCRVVIGHAIASPPVLFGQIGYVRRCPPQDPQWRCLRPGHRHTPSTCGMCR